MKIVKYTVTTGHIPPQNYVVDMLITTDKKGLLIGKYTSNIPRTLRGKKWQATLSELIK